MSQSNGSSSDAYTHAVRDATLVAAKTDHDLGGSPAVVLARFDAALGSSSALIGGRPGFWEAHVVQRRVKGTVGCGDECLPDFKHDL
jgi:hypothetical protein